MINQICCPECGNHELQAITEINTQTTGKNYSGTQGCLGFLLLGPLGLLCGSCGQGQQTTTASQHYWCCPKCGKKFRDIDEIRSSLVSLRKNADISAKVSFVTGIVLSIVFMLMFANMSFGLAFFLSAVGFGISLFVGYISKKTSESQAENLESELRELERKMQKFQNEITKYDESL